MSIRDAMVTTVMVSFLVVASVSGAAAQQSVAQQKCLNAVNKDGSAVAKTQGKGDPMLDEELSKVSPEERAKAEAKAHRWLGDPVDATAPAGQPVPQGQARPLSASPIPFTQMPGAIKR